MKGCHMTRTVLVCALAGFVVSGSALATPEASPEEKHSGVIVAVAPDAHTITLNEMGPWTGPDSQPVQRTLELTPSTTIQLDSRAADARDAGGWPGAFQASALRAADLHPGDFVTVTIERGKPIADSIAVVRPSAATAAK
jgi:hypothetical protein